VVAEAKALARCFGLRELIIGLTVVSIGTSLPEIFVNIASGRAEAPSIGIGNVIGSCFGQMTVILGICVLLGGGAAISHRSLRRDGSILLGSIFLLMFLGADGTYTRPEGMFLISAYVFYIAYLICHGTAGDAAGEDETYCPPFQLKNASRTIFAFLVGLGIIYGASEIIVHKGLMLGERFGLPEVFVGVLSGLGTSIPELVVSLTALHKRSSGIAIGNLIGSNITDPLFSLGIGSAMGHYVFTFTDFIPAFLFWLAGSSLAIFFMRTSWKIKRWEALPLIAVYGGYLWYVLG
jgi:cation:H+ antiporter